MVYKSNYTNILPLLLQHNLWPSSWTPKEWIEVIVPGDKKEKTQVHEGHFLIQRLEPNTEYESKALAKNRFGWSNITDIFKFKTKGMGQYFFILLFKKNK